MGMPSAPTSTASDILFFSAKRRTSFPDRKSTRLNSSHSQISYAVFCLKKKTYSHDGDHSENMEVQYVSSLHIHDCLCVRRQHTLLRCRLTRIQTARLDWYQDCPCEIS